MYSSCNCSGSFILRPPSVEVSHQPAQWPEVQVEVLVLEAELLLELVHPLLEEHEGLTEALDLLRRERPTVDPPQGLALHELAQQLHERHHELGEALLEAVSVRVDAPAQRRVEAVQLVAEQLQVAMARHQAARAARGSLSVAVRGAHSAASVVKLYGGQGPVHTTAASLASASSST